MTDFKELAPCGGTFTLNVQTTDDGRRVFQTGISHSSPTGAAICAVVCDYGGNPLQIVLPTWQPDLADEIGESSGVFTTFLPSDTELRFGHECPRCKKYWRSEGMPHDWPLSCPYCRLIQPSHIFLTSAHRKFLEEIARQLNAAIESEDDGDFDFSLDEITQRIQEGEEPPSFYYREVSQQEQFNCSLCGSFNDILGRFGYCSSCGYRNNVEWVDKEVKRIKDNLDSGGVNRAGIAGGWLM
ncbi:MAG: hypothetical protein ACFE0S_13660 [Rhodospirillales bacterium]